MNNSIIDEVFQTLFSSIGEDVRPEQRLVIQSVLAGKNTLCLMPTGAGKSLCYWIAGKALGGTTLVVFPLTALMDEQALKLEQHGQRVVTLHSGINPQKQYRQLVDLYHGEAPDFIFVSPERLATDGFLEYVLQHRRDQIKLVVIDEIHCISQWGLDFRPFYKEIPPFLHAVFGESARQPTILGLTATLNERDTQQVCQDFRISPKDVLKSRYLLRFSIDLNVVKVEDENQKDQLFWEKLEQHRQEKVLVYIDNRKSGDRSTEGLAEKALSLGFSAAHFHGSMSSSEKAEVIRKFKTGEVLTVFATSAFGMGIDIPDIRGVIHYRLTESIEQYYQQVGRVGRDGKPSWALLYYSDKNISFRKSFFIDKSFPEERHIHEAFTKLTAGRGIIKTFNYFEEEDAQSAFHYLLRSEVLDVVCKGIQNINVFERTASNPLPRFDRYKGATRTGAIVPVAIRMNVPVAEIVRDIYQWQAAGRIKSSRSPAKCLIIEQKSDHLSEERIVEILTDAAEKKSYRYRLLDDLVGLLERYSGSVGLHQEIGRYLGIDESEPGTEYGPDGDVTDGGAAGEVSAVLSTLTDTLPDVQEVMVWTEGRTDWKHLKAAYSRLQGKGMFPHLSLRFHEDEQAMGDRELLTMCRAYARARQPLPTVFVFDRDVPATLRAVTDGDADFKDWGNQVFSVALPVPPHRQETPDVCIEFYYQDSEIMRHDKNGRRLFIGTEFSDRTGRHKLNEALNCTDRNRYGRFTIIDSDVFNESEENVALSKNEFVQNILANTEGFGDFDLSAFVLLFELIEKIVTEPQADSLRTS